MKIVAPIRQLDEIAPLARAGAHELYCGVTPREWAARFRGASANRRPGGNLPSLAALAEAVEIAHRNGVQLSLVLNAQHYSVAQIECAVEIARSHADMGGDAVIASDPGLILALAEALPGLRIHVSSVATCRNAEGARLYRELGARRLILPRDITLDEAAEIAAEVPNMEIEAFVLNDGCVYEEGSCNTLHLPGALGGPICLDRYAYDHRHRDGRPLSPALAARLRDNDEAYRRWLWYRFSCGFSTTAAGMPFGPCGLCAIPAFGRGGLHALKIAGREGPPERKLASVRMVRQILDAHERGQSPAAVAALARGLRPSHAHCATGFMCYYPELAGTAQDAGHEAATTPAAPVVTD
ncbi:U32 family peptidase [Thauera sp.]|uniref:U32 family peptidase n=1 Tax=Thauera sp. TaxID=1905334 RepID=UPI00263A27A1|nr:U32 family peptidase [Thauera sp.]MCK6408028.1 U32 family peptidase [Thauera sp.]